MAEIWLQTADRWGVDQADSYTRAIELGIGSLLEYPERGALVAKSLSGYRKMASGHHLIFYRVDDGDIDVVRVLHQQMDVEAKL